MLCALAALSLTLLTGTVQDGVLWFPIDGEPIFDLDRWNPEFFHRLHSFLSLASELGIVVEVTLFSNTYADSVWNLNPLKASNNKQGVGNVKWSEYTSLVDSTLLERQLDDVAHDFGLGRVQNEVGV